MYCAFFGFHSVVMSIHRNSELWFFAEMVLSLNHFTSSNYLHVSNQMQSSQLYIEDHVA